METGIHYPLRLDALPRGWRAGYVGEFAREIEPGFASGEHNQTGEGVAHLRPMNVDREGKIDLSVTKFVSANKDGRRLAVGDVLFNNTNSPELVGKTAAVSVAGDFAFSNHMTRIRFADDVLPKFGALQLHFLWMRGYFKYNCVKHVNQASVSSRALARGVPFVWAPPVEQERIVAELEKQFSRLDEAVANLRRVKANLKRYVDACLHSAFDLDLLVPNLEIASLGELAEAIVDCPHSTPRWTSEGFICVRTTDFLPGRLDLSAPRYVSRDTFNQRNSRLVPRAGDVLYSREGGILGIACEVPFGAELCMGQRMLLFRAGPRVLPRYVMHLLNSRHILERVEALVGGSASPHLNVRDIRGFPVPVPTLEIQHRIVAEVDRRLSIVREVKTEVDANLKRAQALRQSILLQCFRSRSVTP